MIEITTPLLAGQESDIPWIDAWNTPSIVVAIKTDQNSELYIDFSIDKINVDTSLKYDIAATISEVHRLTITRRFFRMRIKNISLVDQTYLRASIILANQQALSSSLTSLVQQDADTQIVRSYPAELDIAEGKYVGIFLVNGFGQNPDIDGAGNEDIWGGGNFYPGFPDTVGETVSVVSTSANDTIAGTGAKVVRVYGLDANGDMQEEDFNLNGVTPVVGVKIFTRSHRSVVLQSGSNNMAFNLGDITVRHTVTAANIFNIITIGLNESRAAVYTVPKGFTAYVRKLIVSVDKATSNVVSGGVYVKPSGLSPRMLRPFSAGNGTISSDIIYGGIYMPALTDAVIRVLDCSGANTKVIANFDLLLVKT